MVAKDLQGEPLKEIKFLEKSLFIQILIWERLSTSVFSGVQKADPEKLPMTYHD